jgi:hypothetical protein
MITPTQKHVTQALSTIETTLWTVPAGKTWLVMHLGTRNTVAVAGATNSIRHKPGSTVLHAAQFSGTSTQDDAVLRSFFQGVVAEAGDTIVAARIGGASNTEVEFVLSVVET